MDDIEDLLRHLAPQVLGVLLRRYQALDLCEDAVQEALVAAAMEWPAKGAPDSPRAWLITVATRRLIDEVRSESSRRQREDRLIFGAPPAELSRLPGDEHDPDRDDTLILLLLCCHPALTPPSQIALTLNIDGQGKYQVSTGIRFFDHMLELFTKHGGFDLKLEAKGDLDVDQHHTVEDVGIVLGQLFAKALGDRRGINRAGYFVLPMDETLAVVALDLGGRPALVYRDLVRVRLVGDLQTELVEDFFGGFVNHAGANLHARVLYGRSNHHKIEAIFKCFARALRYACSTDRRLRGELPSTKGLL